MFALFWILLFPFIDDLTYVILLHKALTMANIVILALCDWTKF